MSARGGSAILFLCAFAGSACGPSKSEADPRAEKVFERTKRTGATYALYSWNWAKDPDGSARQGWSAEFHRGSLHRVETPDVRVVADCATGSGTMLSVATNEIESRPEIAKAACGINSNPSAARLEWLGEHASRFGPIERIRITDSEFERVYAVDRAGILVASEFHAPDPDEPACVQNEPLAIEHSLPEGEIFSPESLRRSHVADKFRAAPGAPVGDLWINARRSA